MLSSTSCRPSVGVIAASVAFLGARPHACRTVARLAAVGLTAITLSACSQFVADAKKVSAPQARQASSKQVAVVEDRETRPVRSRGARTKVAAATPSDGMASFYKQGSRTASGEKFNPRELTAAHPTLPFGTRVRVTNVNTGRSVTVRINDRGPFVRGRVIDVSHSAAESLGMVGQGVAKVKLDVVE
jgi:rare lipoprotein A